MPVERGGDGATGEGLQAAALALLGLEDDEHLECLRVGCRGVGVLGGVGALRGVGALGGGGGVAWFVGYATRGVPLVYPSTNLVGSSRDLGIDGGVALG